MLNRPKYLVFNIYLSNCTTPTLKYFVYTIPPYTPKLKTHVSRAFVCLFLPAGLTRTGPTESPHT